MERCAMVPPPAGSTPADASGALVTRPPVIKMKTSRASASPARVAPPLASTILR
jgi:hypothetical protein